MKKNIYIALGVIFVAVVVQIFLSNLAVFENLELTAYDLREKASFELPFFKKYVRKADKDIVIVSIDDYSKKKLIENESEGLSQLPWHRDVWTDVVKFIEQGEPKAVLFDMVFENLNENTWNDRKFAQELRHYDNIVLGTYLDNPKIKADRFASQINIEKNDYLPSAQPLSVVSKDKTIDKNITYFENAPVRDLYVDSNTIGVLNKVLDRDNVIRKNRPVYKLVKNGETYYLPSLAFAGFLKYMGEDGNVYIKNSKIYYKDRVIPVDNQGTVNINWHNAGRNYTYIPISKILINADRRKDLKAEFFKDKIVIIGKTTANGAVDLESIINPSYTSPEANAVALDNYINDTIPSKSIRKFVSEVPKPIQFLVTLLACVFVGLIGWYSKKAWIGFTGGMLSILLYVAVSFLLFVEPHSRLLLPIVVPVYYLIITSVTIFIFKLNREINEKHALLTMFEKYVSPNVLYKVLKNPEKLALKTTKKHITVLCCDVKDFSRLSERYEPEKLVANLNELFKEIVNIIFANNGTVDKFMGDSIMAYWGDFGGDLDEDENHAYRAVKTALEIKKRVTELKVQNVKDNKIIFDVKIGINTGEAILGLAGTEKITSYTAMGEAVNTASRLESSCSSLGRDILIAKSTYQETKDKIIVIDVGEVQAKGKFRKVEAYEPIGFTKSAVDENEKLKMEPPADKK